MLEKYLKEKGWSEEEIKKAISIMQKAEIRKPEKIKRFEEIVYWAVLIVTIIGNSIIAIILVPFLLALSSYPLYFIIFTIAITFGFLFDLIIKDIDAIENKNIIVAWLLIPSLAIINVFFMVEFANHLISITLINNPHQHNPFLIGFVYTFAFCVPYFGRKIINNLKDKSFSKYL